MKSYLEISISSNERQREFLIPTMLELGCEGFQDTDGALLCYLETSRWNSEKHDLLLQDLRKILQTISVNAAVSFREIPKENWNAEWERTIQPIEVGTRFVIRPSWADYRGDEGRIVIQIDPKMSFGTGYHETTRLTLRLLEQYLTPRDKVLDVGTGTGILAIAAVKLGALAAEATDIDDWAIENANENILSNGVPSDVHVSKTPIEEFSEGQFHLLTANLTLDTIVEFLPQFSRVLRPKGMLLLSGLLATDRSRITEALHLHMFHVAEELTENEWIALAARNRE